MVTSTAPSSDSTTELTGGQLTSRERERDRLLGSTASDQHRPKYNTLDNGDEHRHVPDETVGGAGNDEDDEFDAMEQFELEERAKRPFYRRPSPWWLIITMAVGSTVISTAMAPRIDLYSSLVCERLKPEITSLSHFSDGTISPTATWKTFPVPSKECVQDAQVQAAVAALNTILTASSGILGCLTVGWWGQFSDRHGRIPMLIISAGGLLITDGNFLLVTQLSDWLPGGYSFLIVGAVLGGLFGGVPTFMAITASYIADTSPPELRARNLSLKTGLLLCGLAFGPSLGSYIVKRTNNLLSVFYIAFVTHLLFVLLIPITIPESLTKASMLKARRRQKEATLKEQQLASSEDVRGLVNFLILYLKKIFAFARPVGILLPRKRSDGKGWDCNLFLVSITMFLNLLTMGIYGFTMQFLQRVFGWDSTTSGYWFSVVTIAKAICLAVIIPLIIQIFKPKTPQHIKLSEEEESLLTQQDEILLENATIGSRSSSRSRPNLKSTHHTASFDYKLTIFALIMEVVTYSSMSLARNAIQFTGACMIGGLAAGFSPAIKSVAISLYEQGSASRGERGSVEVGRLFGALGIIEAMSGSFLGPILFGSVFMKTVGVLPQAIYMVSLGVVALGFVFFLFIRLPPAAPTPSTPRDSRA